MATCSAPTASVAQYQLLPQEVGPELVFLKMDYSFKRTTRWVTVTRRYKDQKFELMPNAVVPMYEFTVKMDRWTCDDITALEAFVDSVKGNAYPFQFKAPDDGVMYPVRFKTDEQGYSVPSAAVRTGQVVLVTAGDVDNSINNDAAYPPYIENIYPPEFRKGEEPSPTSCSE